MPPMCPNRRARNREMDAALNLHYEPEHASWGSISASARRSALPSVATE